MADPMTMGEFLAREAENEGHGDPARVLADIFRELTDDDARMVAEYMRPEKAMEILRRLALDDLTAWQADSAREPLEITEHVAPGINVNVFRDAGPRPPMPIEVLRVDNAVHRQRATGASTGEFTALCLCDDGKERFARWSFGSHPGDRMNQPEHDEFIEWTEAP